MPELKTMKEWNPQKGDMFRFHLPFSNSHGDPRTFRKWKNAEEGTWHSEESPSLRCGDEESGKWELVRRAAPTITLDKEWAYRHTPTQPVRILCVNGNDKGKPVVSMGPEGNLSAHDSHGAFLSGGGESGFDLVPLKKSFGPVWAVFSRKGTLVKSRTDEKVAQKELNWLNKHGTHPPYTLVKLVEEK